MFFDSKHAHQFKILRKHTHTTQTQAGSHRAPSHSNARASISGSNSILKCQLFIKINFNKLAVRFANLYAIHIHMSESINIISQIYYSLGQYLSTSGERNFRGSRNFEHPGIFLKKNIHHTNKFHFV